LLLLLATWLAEPKPLAVFALLSETIRLKDDDPVESENPLRFTLSTGLFMITAAIALSFSIASSESSLELSLK
jgi:hypothetical protein